MTGTGKLLFSIIKLVVPTDKISDSVDTSRTAALENTEYSSKKAFFQCFGEPHDELLLSWLHKGTEDIWTMLSICDGCGTKKICVSYCNKCLWQKTGWRKDKALFICHSALQSTCNNLDCGDYKRHNFGRGFMFLMHFKVTLSWHLRHSVQASRARVTQLNVIDEITFMRNVVNSKWHGFTAMHFERDGFMCLGKYGCLVIWKDMVE